MSTIEAVETTTTSTSTSTTTTSMSKVERFYRWLILQEGSTRPLALFRIAFAAMVLGNLGEHFLFWKVLPGGHGDERTLLQHVAVGIIGTLILVGGSATVVGWHTRIAASAFAAGLLLAFFWVGGTLEIKAFRHHHTQFMMMLATTLAIAPSGRSFSVDRWRALQKAKQTGIAAPPEWAPLFGQRFVCVVVSSLYLGGAVDKLRLGFLNGHELERIFCFYFTDATRLPMFPGFWATMAIGGVVFEFMLALLLWLPRWQKPLIVLSIPFHFLLAFTMNVGSFGIMAVAASLLFLDPARIERVIAPLLGSDVLIASSPDGEEVQRGDMNS